MILTELYVNLGTQGVYRGISISMNKLQQHSNAYILYIRHVTLINTIRKLYILHLYCLAKLRKVHINNLLLGIRKLKVQVEKCFQIL